MEEKVLVRTKSGISVIPTLGCFGFAILLLIICFSVATEVGGDPSWAFRGIEYGYWGFFVGAGLSIIVGLILLFFLKKEITVTTKFVYIKKEFFKIAMPVEKITCIKKGLLKSITVVVPSSRVACLWVEKDEEVYNCLIKLICEK